MIHEAILPYKHKGNSAAGGGSGAPVRAPGTNKVSEAARLPAGRSERGDFRQDPRQEHFPNLDNTPTTSLSLKSAMEPIDQNQETPISYYNSNRKRSFFFSRIFVMFSMFVLIIALSINVSFLYSQEKTATTSKASNNEQTPLPSLPAGCEYQPTFTGKGFTVVCSTPTPNQPVKPATAATSAASVSVTLPNLPSQCSYVLTPNGYLLTCQSPQTPIPTTAVTLPSSCTTTNNSANPIKCTDAKDTSEITTLPKLPLGCVYKGVGTKTYIACTAQ